MERTYNDEEEKKINNMNNEDIIQERIYKSNNDYLLDIFIDEEERLLEKLGNVLSEENKYLFYRYICVRETIASIKA